MAKTPDTRKMLNEAKAFINEAVAPKDMTEDQIDNEFEKLQKLLWKGFEKFAKSQKKLTDAWYKKYKDNEYFEEAWDDHQQGGFENFRDDPDELISGFLGN